MKGAAPMGQVAVQPRRSTYEPRRAGVAHGSRLKEAASAFSALVVFRGAVIESVQLTERNLDELRRKCTNSDRQQERSGVKAN